MLRGVSDQSKRPLLASKPAILHASASVAMRLLRPRTREAAPLSLSCPFSDAPSPSSPPVHPTPLHDPDIKSASPTSNPPPTRLPATAPSRIDAAPRPGSTRRLEAPARPKAAWLRSPELDDLQELELWYGFSPIAMSSAAFRFSSSLRALTLSVGGSVFGGGEFVQFPSEDVDKFHFPHLKQLTIQCITINDSSIHTLLTKCPVLEILVLSQNEGFHCLGLVPLPFFGALLCRLIVRN